MVSVSRDSCCLVLEGGGGGCGDLPLWRLDLEHVEDTIEQREGREGDCAREDIVKQLQ